MAWTAPITWTAGSTLTAAQLNTYLRDNLLLSAPALASTPGAYMVATGANTLAQRKAKSAYISTSQTTTSTTMTDLATSGPAVTVTTGTRAFVVYSCAISNSGANNATFMSFAVSGATTEAAADSYSISLDGVSATQAPRLSNWRWSSLTAGSNTFTAKYRVDAGTGTFAQRRISVFPF